MIEKNSWPVSKLIAHRGASAYAPENTLAALEKAGELGAAWVEVDVRLTLDGEVVVFHDARLDRCTNGRGMVRKTPYAVIEKLDAGSWFSSRFAHEKIPTLDQWLQVASKQGCGIILDLKGSLFDFKRLADQVSVLLSRYWGSHLPQPIISSESVVCLRAMAAHKLGLSLAYIMRKEHRGWQKVVKQLHCVAVHLDHQFISETWLNSLKKNKLHIAAYTVNDPLRAQQLFDWGVDSVFSDDPMLLSND